MSGQGIYSASIGRYINRGNTTVGAIKRDILLNNSDGYYRAIEGRIFRINNGGTAVSLPHYCR